MSSTRRIHVQPADDAVLVQGMADIQRELKLPLAFPPEVEAAALQAARHPRLPVLDRSDIPLAPLIRRSRWIWTRRCMSSASARAIG